MILCAGCSSSRINHKPSPDVKLLLTFETTEVVVGAFCKVQLKLINHTENSIWCAVPAVRLAKGPAGFQPNGMHISPMMETHLSDG